MEKNNDFLYYRSKNDECGSANGSCNKYMFHNIYNLDKKQKNKCTMAMKYKKIKGSRSPWQHI
jgi:hypothetical protein